MMGTKLGEEALTWEAEDRVKVFLEPLLGVGVSRVAGAHWPLELHRLKQRRGAVPDLSVACHLRKESTTVAAKRCEQSLRELKREEKGKEGRSVTHFGDDGCRADDRVDGVGLRADSEFDAGEHLLQTLAVPTRRHSR